MASLISVDEVHAKCSEEIAQSMIDGIEKVTQE